jgi:hypothetical protein
MTIKHLFIGGGSFYGFSFFGILKQACISNVMSLPEIKTIHGISAGSMIGTIISLGFDWDILEDYIINRPWDKLFSLNMYSLIHSIQNRGIFSKPEFDEIFKPLFSAKEISTDITMREFHEHTGIEHYYYISQLTDKLHSIVVSHKTHPNWKLLDVVYMSSCLPILFSPIIMDGGDSGDGDSGGGDSGGGENGIYLDGICGIIGDPIESLLCDTENIDKEQLLSINMENCKTPPLTISTASLFDYLVHFLLALINKGTGMKPKPSEYYHKYVIEREPYSLQTFYLALNDKNERIRLVDLGVKTFLAKNPSDEKTGA